MPSWPHVPSLSFHPTPTVSSPPDFAGLLHPAIDPGVRRVSILTCGRAEARPRDWCEALLIGACPSKRFPRPQRVACHHAPCLLAVGTPVVSCILANALDPPTPSTSRLCSTNEAVANAPPLPVECCSLLPWASRLGVCPAPPVAVGATGNCVGEPFGTPLQGLLLHPSRQARWANSRRCRRC